MLLNWTLHRTLTGLYTECDFVHHSWPHAELWADPQEAHLSGHFCDPNNGYGCAAEEFDFFIPGSLSGHLLGAEPMPWRKLSCRPTRATSLQGSLRDCGDEEGRPDTAEPTHTLHLLASRKAASVLKGQFAV